MGLPGGSITEVLVLALAYFIAGLKGSLAPLVPHYASVIWPPAGIALAGLLILGRSRWPGVLIGAMAVNI